MPDNYIFFFGKQNHFSCDSFLLANKLPKGRPNFSGNPPSDPYRIHIILTTPVLGSLAPLLKVEARVLEQLSS